MDLKAEPRSDFIKKFAAIDDDRTAWAFASEYGTHFFSRA
jgi:hypothetical protein